MNHPFSPSHNAQDGAGRVAGDLATLVRALAHSAPAPTRREAAARLGITVDELAHVLD